MTNPSRCWASSSASRKPKNKREINEASRIQPDAAFPIYIAFPLGGNARVFFCSTVTFRRKQKSLPLGAPPLGECPQSGQGGSRFRRGEGGSAQAESDEGRTCPNHHLNKECEAFSQSSVGDLSLSKAPFGKGAPRWGDVAQRQRGSRFRRGGCRLTRVSGD